MDRYCSECNTTMTPSLVGYLCSNCGNLQRFYTASDSMAQITTLPRIERVTVASSGDAVNSAGPLAPDTTPNPVRSTLKRLLVPELSPPHPHQTLAVADELSTKGSDNIGAPLPAIEPLSSSPPIGIASTKDSGNSQHPASNYNSNSGWVWIIASLALAILALALYSFS